MQTNSRPRTKVGFFFRKKETTMVEKTTIVSTTKSLAAGVSATFLEVLKPISYSSPHSFLVVMRCSCKLSASEGNRIAVVFSHSVQSCSFFITEIFSEKIHYFWNVWDSHFN